MATIRITVGSTGRYYEVGREPYRQRFCAEKAVDEAFAPRMSMTIKGRQMDSEWIDKNLEKSVSDDLYDEIVDAIDRKKVDFVASKVTNDGNITYYKLDSSGKIMRDSDNIPVIYHINKE